MKDLSREEKLRRQISMLEDEFDKRKWVRVRKTFFALSGAIYSIAFMIGEIRGDIKEYLSWLVIAPIAAGLVMVASLLVLLYIITGAMSDEKYIAKLEGKLEEINHSKHE